MKRRNAVAIVAVLVVCGLVPNPSDCVAQLSSDEHAVRAVLAEFKQGIDSGDAALAPQLTTGPYAFQFVSLYTGLAEAYHKYQQPMPMEIGHVKILEDGRAKVETYLNPNRDLIVFTLTKQGEQWKFTHQEGTLFPIFEFPAVPYTNILQLPESKVGFMAAERDLAFRSRVYRQIEAEHGTAAARAFFQDGPGFKVAMDAWLPFLEGAGQFAIFLAVLESNYYGSGCTVTEATKQEAEVAFKPLRDLEALKIAVFDPKLSPEEFRALYVAVMKDRGDACGLDVDVSIQDADCVVHVRKKM